MTQYRFNSENNKISLPKYDIWLKRCLTSDRADTWHDERTKIISYDKSTHTCHLLFKNFTTGFSISKTDENDYEYIDISELHLHIDIDNPNNNYVIECKSKKPEHPELFNQHMSDFVKRVFLSKIQKSTVRDLWFVDERSFEDQNVYVGYERATLEFEDNHLKIHYDNDFIRHDNNRYILPPYIAFKSEKQYEHNSQRYHARLEFTTDTILKIPTTETDLHYEIDLTQAQLTNHHATRLVDCNFESIFATKDNISVFDSEYIDTLYKNIKLIKLDGNIAKIIQKSELYFSKD